MYKERFSEADFLSVDPSTVVADANCVDIEAFDARFLEAAKDADEAGDKSRALAFRLFAAVSRFHFRPEDKAEPFSNMASFGDGTRTLMGSDFDREDIHTLASVADKIDLLPLRTRIADLVWSRDKSRVAHSRLAIDGYVQMVLNVLSGVGTLRFERSSATGISVQNFLERALVIARSTGWEKAENDALRGAFTEVIRAAVTEGGMALVRFARLGLRYGIENVEAEVGDLDSKADEARLRNEFHEAIALQELANSIAARKNQGEISSEGRLRLAKIHESQADASGDSSFLQTHSLQLAIDALQGAKGVREERQRLHERLKEAQLHFADEMGSFGHSMDLSDEVKRLLDGYSGLDLLECLKRLALTELPRDPDKMIDEAREQAQKYPLSSLFATSLLDRNGRTVARTGGGIEENDTLRHKVIQQFDISMSLAIGAAVVPARTEITQRFYIPEQLLYWICRYSPFVPNGYETQIARGLHAFLYGDEIVAGSLLIPFLEAGLRALVAAAGRADTTISLGGIEQTIGLGNLLGQHRDILEKVFGVNQIFAVENLFVHELGPKVRHTFCHGMTEDGSFYSHQYVYACKLIFSLVMLPLVQEATWRRVKPELEKHLQS
ncbi:DUF7380 domain-containing protein [Tsuneonella rigui]|uniref:DUF7380 domain-containing protein n=1 Tax=Tsuneonella rigui TaxID=1708790 RepID=UPI000F7E7B7A|nr:hypothetical protein [Tsuneonella rigui]